MTTNLDPASQLFLSDVSRIQQRLAQAGQEVSSGRKVSKPSDAPDQIGALLQLRADQKHNQQIEANLTLAETNAQASDSALAASIQLMDKAVALGAQGATSASGTDFQSLAGQVQSILDEMVAYSQTTVQGQYIFSGDLGQFPTYQANHFAAGGVVQISNAPATERIEAPSGPAIPAKLNAQQIFDLRNADGTHAPGNVFDALSGLAAALSGGNVQAVASAVDSVKTASAHLNQMEAFYGNVEGQIQSAQKFAGNYDMQLQAEISQIQDADIPAAAMELTQGQTQLQAAFGMRASMPRKTLFDYLG